MSLECGSGRRGLGAGEGNVVFACDDHRHHSVIRLPTCTRIVRATDMIKRMAYRGGSSKLYTEGLLFRHAPLAFRQVYV